MSGPRKIAFFTGNRSEYGLQYPLIKAIAAHPPLEYRLIVGGDHFSGEHGATVSEIEQDGFVIHERVRHASRGDNLLSSTRRIGRGVVAVSRALDRLQPDCAIVYGDRYEAFAAMIASSQMGIPTAHVEGGDYTEGGALDDSVRHAMTKLAHLHFATNAQAANRIRSLGEEPWRVFQIGLPSLDLIAQGDFTAPAELAGQLELDLGRPVILFCQHPVATECARAREQIRPSLQALCQAVRAGWQTVVTYPNSDPGAREMVAAIEALAAERIPGMTFVGSLGRRRFHGLLSTIAGAGGAVVGNSSAGLKETAIVGVPVVNIGSRQRGRLRGENVLDVDYDAPSIFRAIRRCIEDADFIRHCRTTPNPYGTGDAGPRFARILATVPMDARLLQKKLTY